MKKNVIAALLPVAGLAMVASAQVPQVIVENGWVSYTRAGVGTLEVRWAIDGDSRNAQASNPIDFAGGIPSFLPGAGATAVGLTLQARFTALGANPTIPAAVTGQGNYGIARVSFGTTNSYNRISHTDAVSNGWTGAISRGQTTMGSGTGVVATDGYALFGATSQFRNFIGAYGSARTNTSNWNAANGNAVSGQNVIPGNAQAGAGAWSLPGITGSPAGVTTRSRVGNGIQAQNASGRTEIVGFDASINTSLPGDVTGNFGTGIAIGEASQWINIYRVVFNPRPNAGTDSARNVTVTGNANFLYTSAVSFNATSGSTLLRADTFLGTAQDAIAPVTFQVPTPAGAALLGLGGLAAFRRRR